MDITKTPNSTKADIITCACTCITTTTATGGKTTTGSGGLGTLSVAVSDALPLTILDNNAPNRVYVSGNAIYCSQSNASPTTKIENCTTGGQGASSFSATVGMPITMDPVVPPTATPTTGLVAPDGIGSPPRERCRRQSIATPAPGESVRVRRDGGSG